MNIFVFLHQLIFFARTGGSDSSSGGGGGALVILAGSVGIAVTVPSIFLIYKWTRSIVAAYSIGTIVGLALAPIAFAIKLHPNLIIGYVMGVIECPICLICQDIQSKRFEAEDRRKHQRIQQLISQAAVGDILWNEQQIIEQATMTFNRFQYDWEKMNLPSIQRYTTPNYARHISLMLRAMEQMGRVNMMKDDVVHSAIIVEVVDNPGTKRDRVSIEFSAQANDLLVEKATGRVLTSTNEPFVEQWNFVHGGSLWMLDGINRRTSGSNHSITALRKFATQNNMYFSSGLGNVLLPVKGRLFKRSFFIDGEINNHIIGFWSSDLLVQLYVYRVARSDGYKNYLIGQVNLPASYNGIIIQRQEQKAKGLIKAPRGYEKISFEWPDFNRRYAVYATSRDKVASFELLNPGFMGWLYDQNLRVNIEVVDNVVYFYADVLPNGDKYAEMMTVLQKAYKELKV